MKRGGRPESKTIDGVRIEVREVAECVYAYGQYLKRNFAKSDLRDGSKTRRWAIPDREAGALRRVAAVCAALGCHYYHQTDPRGCALYVSRDKLNDADYTRGVGVSA